MLKPERGHIVCTVCHRVMTPEEAKWWGECPGCNTELPIRTSQMGDRREGERKYHGGQFHRGEW